MNESDQIRLFREQYLLPSTAVEKASKTLARRKRHAFTDIVPAEPPILTPITRRIMETASELEIEELTRITYQHTVLCQTVMPYRAHPDRTWEQRNGSVHLLLEAGTAFDRNAQGYVHMPLPHGVKPRLILMHLNAEAIRTCCPSIELGHSLTSFVKRILGYQPNGREIAAFLDQATALASSYVRLAVDEAGVTQQINSSIISGMELWQPNHPEQRVIWPSFITLGETYFENLAKHAVPLDERAVGALKHSAVALDLYAWLAQRLHRIPRRRDHFVPWGRLHQQFGGQYKRTRDFKRFFKRQLNTVRCVYPEARFTLDDRRGMTLRNSRPPVKPRIVTDVKSLLPAASTDPESPFRKTLRAIGRASGAND